MTADRVDLPAVRERLRRYHALQDSGLTGGALLAGAAIAGSLVAADVEDLVGEVCRLRTDVIRLEAMLLVAVGHDDEPARSL